MLSSLDNILQKSGMDHLSGVDMYPVTLFHSALFRLYDELTNLKISVFLYIATYLLCFSEHCVAFGYNSAIMSCV